MADNDTTVVIVDPCWVVKLDAVGDMLWERDLGDCELTAASGTGDGSIVIIGRQDDCPLALKMDANGSVEWRWEVRETVQPSLNVYVFCMARNKPFLPTIDSRRKVSILAIY